MNKRLGQYFLRDPKILKKIVDFAHLEPEDTVVEIGPGEGVLTKFLLERAKRVITIEKDTVLVQKLKERFREQITDNRLQIIAGDVLDYNLKSGDYKLIGNIPYYITSAIFEKFLQCDNPPKSITFVVQKEIAKRIMDKKGSILSISVKIFGEPEYGGVIKAGSFYPKPKVDSAIIAIRNIGVKKFKSLKVKKFFEILKKGFAHKRKLLMKNLGTSKTVFDRCNISEKARAEDLKVEDWIALVKEIDCS